MSTISGDLEQFLEVVSKVSASVADDSAYVGDRWKSVENAGLPSLARDTTEEADALQWLAHSVRVAAGASPSLAFILATRYAADLTLGDKASQSPTFALMSHTSDPVVPTSPVPDEVVILHLDDLRIMRLTWTEAEGSLAARPMTGLAAARPVPFSIRSASQPVSANFAATIASWDLLAAAALVGIAERAVEVTQAYVLERRQFGVPIGSFSGLRALVAGMSLRAEPARAQLDRALVGEGSSDSVAALAGRAAVDNCLDAIQSHGGYGYIDEYPVANLLRDAISLQARSGGRRLHVAKVARRGLGEPVAGRRL